MHRTQAFLVTLVIAAIAALGCASPVVAATPRGSIEEVFVYGKTLEGNLAGDPATRSVSVYLPPSYKRAKTRRYPVLYLLHGFQQTNADWYAAPTAALHVPTIMDRAIAAGAAREMIVVTPNAMTVYGGSNYSSGQTTGDWESFIASDLVRYVDRRYRTVANAAHRALSGHSMGGYGAMRIGMKHPGVFSTLYLLSPCCISPESNIPTEPAAIAKLEALKTRPSGFREIDPAIRTSVAAAAAWAPNPANPPLYFDLPHKHGVRQEAVIARMTSNRPLAMIDQYIRTLKTQAIAFDVGNQDMRISANMRELHRIFTAYGVVHQFQTYDGNHTNRIPERLERNLLPFVSSHFRLGAGKPRAPVM